MGYLPSLGTFVSRDPLGTDAYESEGMNPYQFVGDNPLTYVDPSGQLRVSTQIEFAADYTWIDSLHHSLPGTGSWEYMSNIDSATSWANRVIFLAGDQFRTPLKYDANSTSSDKCSYCVDDVTISGHGTSGMLSLGEQTDKNGKSHPVDLTKMSFNMLKNFPDEGAKLPEIGFLSAIKSKLCKDATIRIVSCYSSTLSNEIASFFGPGYTIITYDGKVSWGMYGATGSKKTTTVP